MQGYIYNFLNFSDTDQEWHKFSDHKLLTKAIKEALRKAGIEAVDLGAAMRNIKEFEIFDKIHNAAFQEAKRLKLKMCVDILRHFFL